MGFLLERGETRWCLGRSRIERDESRGRFLTGFFENDFVLVKEKRSKQEAACCARAKARPIV